VTSREFQDRLARRSRHAGVSISSGLAESLEIYFKLLAAWTTKINLTGFDLSDPGPEALDRLLIEPLVVAKHVPAKAVKVIDIGSGGGSPAIPLALARPLLRLTMVESKTRKSVFLREAIRALDLHAVEVVAKRFEELLSQPTFHENFDILTVRAVRFDHSTLSGLQTFVKPGGNLFIFRGTTETKSPYSIFPPLEWKETVTLSESPRSVLTVLQKE
jgi:16S rRNA (guanine527-N7)-methyltransferase